MVAYAEIKAANASLRKEYTTLTAVFTGATSGIGLATLKAFAQHIPKPKAVIVGRSRSRFEPELQKLRAINPNGEYIFLETEISLLKNIDAVTEQIKRQVGSIDLLFMSQGYIELNGRHNTTEGLDNATVLRYYGRVRLTENLLPIMSAHARTVSVLGAGWEGKIVADDLDLERNYSVVNLLGHFVTLMTLAFDKLAQQNPGKAFLHTYPGVVNTGMLGKHNTGIQGMLVRFVELLMSFFVFAPEEAGERTLYDATSAQFAEGSWSLSEYGVPQTAKALTVEREKGMVEPVWEHTRKIFERVTGA